MASLKIRLRVGRLREAIEELDMAPRSLYRLVIDALGKAGKRFNRDARGHFIDGPPSRPSAGASMMWARSGNLRDAIGFKLNERPVLPGGGPARRWRAIDLGLFPERVPESGGLSRFVKYARTQDAGGSPAPRIAPTLAFPPSMAPPPLRDARGTQLMTLGEAMRTYSVSIDDARRYAAVWNRGGVGFLGLFILRDSVRIEPTNFLGKSFGSFEKNALRHLKKISPGDIFRVGRARVGRVTLLRAGDVIRN